jgi:type I restriction enzyme S subunit
MSISTKSTSNSTDRRSGTTTGTGAGVDASTVVGRLHVNPDWAKLPLFDRKQWTKVRFGDVVENVNETEREPLKAGIVRFIGLEHLEPGSLHVRAWGNVADGMTFTRRCRPGQVLFGKRRAYQRKVAVAEFDAVVSGDIYVLDPKEDRLLPELLPFLCLSERFFKFAVETSAGSLSPRTNWSHLAEFNFDLPPLDQQRRLAEILCAVDEVEQKYLQLVIDTDGLRSAELERELDGLFLGPCDHLNNLLLKSPESGACAPPSATETGHYVLSLAALSKAGYARGHLKSVPPSAPMLAARLSLDDFLISRSNTQELVGHVGMFNENRDDVSFPDTMMRLPVNEKRILKKFLEVVLQSRRGRMHMMRSAAGTSGSMKKINRRTLGPCLVPTPALGVQKELLIRLEGRRKLSVSVVSASKHSQELKRAVLESTFATLS